VVDIFPIVVMRRNPSTHHKSGLHTPPQISTSKEMSAWFDVGAGESSSPNAPRIPRVVKAA